MMTMMMSEVAADKLYSMLLRCSSRAYRRR